MPINYSDINRKLGILGEEITIYNYVGTTPQFDVDQNPLNIFTTGTVHALITSPSRLDLNSFGGLITKSTKKIIVPTDTTIAVSDDIYLSSGTVRAIEIQEMITRTVIFANNYSP